MAVWLKSGELEVGVIDGVVRRRDFAELVEACRVSEFAAERLADADAQAQEIVATALQQAEDELERARGESQRLREQACEQGRREAAERWADEMAHKAFEAHHGIQRASDRLAELVSLAAQRVIEAEDREGLYRRALRSVRSLASDSKTLTLHVGADDVDHARSVVGEIAARLGIPVPLDIRVDGRLTGGGCVLESDQGVIDASMGLQIEAVKQAIGRAARAALARMDAAAATSRATQPPTQPPQTSPGSKPSDLPDDPRDGAWAQGPDGPRDQHAGVHDGL